MGCNKSFRKAFRIPEDDRKSYNADYTDDGIEELLEERSEKEVEYRIKRVKAIAITSNLIYPDSGPEALLPLMETLEKLDEEYWGDGKERDR